MDLKTIRGIVQLLLVACIITGCGKPVPKLNNNPREEALQTYLDIQKSIANNDYETFVKFLETDMQLLAKNNPKGIQMFFRQLASENGPNLSKVFNNDIYFELEDDFSDCDTPPKIRRKIYFIPKDGKAQLVYPSQEQIKGIEEYRELRRKIGVESQNGLPAELEQDVSEYLAQQYMENGAKEWHDAAFKELWASSPGDDRDIVERFEHYGLFLDETLETLPLDLTEKISSDLNNMGWVDDGEAFIPFFVFIRRNDAQYEDAFRTNLDAFTGPYDFYANWKGDSLYGYIRLSQAEDGKWGVRLH